MAEPSFSITYPTPATNMTYSVPNTGLNSNFIVSDGTQALTGTLKVDSISANTTNQDLKLQGDGTGNVRIMSPSWLVPELQSSQSLGHPAVNWKDLNLGGGVYLNGNSGAAGSVNFQALSSETTSGNVVLYKFPTGELNLQAHTPQVYGVLSISAPTGSVAGSGATAREATLTLQRADGSGNAEFIDHYSNGYITGFPASHQAGTRIQKRGTGSYIDYVWDYYDGSTFLEAMRISGATQGVNVSNSLTVGGNLTVTGSINAGEKTDFQKFVSYREFARGNNDFAEVRLAAGNWALQKAALAETAVVETDITQAIRTTASKGFKLTSIDIIYSVAEGNLSATPSEVLQSKTFANNAAVTLTSIPVGGTAYGTAVQANPYVINRTVTTPTYLNTPSSCISLELSFPTASTTILTFYGANLRFTAQLS